MMRRGCKPHRGGAVGFDAASNDAAFQLGDADRERIREEMAKIRYPVDGVMFNGADKGSLGMRGMLALPPDLVQERMLLVVTSYQLVSALVLTSAIPFAFAPMKVSELPESTQTAGHVCNVLCARLVVISLCSSVTMTWAVTCMSGITDEVAHSVANGVKNFVNVELVSAWQKIIIMILVNLAAWIHSPTLAAAITTFLTFSSTA